MYSFSGIEIHPDRGVPTLADIGIQLARIPRFCGSLKFFYPVLLHSFVVADLLPKESKVYGLLHDASECYFSDIPRPVKPPEIKEAEAPIFDRICRSIGIPEPGIKHLEAIKRADVRAYAAERWLMGCRRGYTEEVLDGKPLHREPAAEKLVTYYLNFYSHDDLLNSAGAAPRDFMKRVYRIIWA